MAAGKKGGKASGAKGRNHAHSAPEVKLSYGSAGRDTLAAIESELSADSLSVVDAPVIEVSESPAGRETMAAIAEELASEMRPRQNTLPYGDRISNAPGARSPSVAPAPKPLAGSPPPGATPMAPVSTARPASSQPGAQLAEGSVEIFELLTFIIRGNKVGDLSTDALRRRFVEQHLLHRVPGGALENVERIEVTPWTAKGTMVVRLWCKA